MNVGLRTFIWESKSVEQQLTRELWSLNNATYHAYRQYVSNCKENGFPEQQALHVQRRPSSAGNTNVAASDISASSMASQAVQIPTPYSFAGMQHILQESNARVTVLKFGRLSSELLAYGAMDGVVRIAVIGQTSTVNHVLKQHMKAVCDIDWSLDNTFLLSAGMEGSISMWMTATGQLLRIFLTASPACCANFHLVNQSLVMAGTESGMIQVFSTGTGKLVLGQSLTGASKLQNGLSCSVMAVSNNLLFVADSKGCISTLRCDIKNGQLQALAVLTRTPLPNGRVSEPASLVYCPYSSTARSQALLLSTADGHVSLIKIADAVAGRLDVVTSVEVPRAARKIRATLCPKVQVTDPESIVMGGEDTCVYIYDISKPGSGALVLNQLQGHMAPVVDVSWSYDEQLLGSCDCDGAVILWRRERIQ